MPISGRSMCGGSMPLHRIAVDDAAGTRLYVTENGGEVVRKTDGVRPALGRLGAVMHWLYFTPFRRNASLWSNTIISGLDCRHGDVHRRACVGLLAAGAASRLSASRSRQWTPYAGVDALAPLRSGLIFGITTTDVGVQRVAVDGSVGLESRHRGRRAISGSAWPAGRSSVVDLPPPAFGDAVAAFTPRWPRRSRSCDSAAAIMRAQPRASCRSMSRTSAPPISCRLTWWLAPRAS